MIGVDLGLSILFLRDRLGQELAWTGSPVPMGQHTMEAPALRFYSLSFVLAPSAPCSFSGCMDFLATQAALSEPVVLKGSLFSRPDFSSIMGPLYLTV